MDDSINLNASILDRLLDDDPKTIQEPSLYRVLSEKQILDNVIRDIENLLNTRCSPIDIPAPFKNLKRSLIRYGISDFSVENPGTSTVRQKLCKEIETAISVFEPRLKKPVVRIERENHDKRKLFFRISGILVMEPLSEPVSFDTFFDLNRGRYVISK
ncbi:type VI secretion system baseplate subunit TssE [Desulfospira joergensenii]|uniref:type VI secretion system baseplate subunit TssE n=1 Tax=Desulfospira joergensenii TaxID=53329 RepID=UPI0003B53A36|nr:type VI secretion system baseplate subunit TssE [Desulfospira joergensenii]